MSDNCGCQPDCCLPGQQAPISHTFDGAPMYDAGCMTTPPVGQSFAPAAGEVIAAGQVVWFTGNQVDVSIDGQTHSFEEVSITPSGNVAGIALYDIDNTLDDVGAVEFLVQARVFANRIDMNGATSAQLRAVGLIVVNVYQ